MQSQNPPAAPIRVLNHADATAMVAAAISALDTLEPIIAQETALLREGMTRKALSFASAKAEAAAAYTRSLEALKGNAIALGRFAPDTIALLRRRHEGFSELLTYNMAVLTTARTVSETIMREISREIAAIGRPAIYGPAGSTTKPASYRPSGAPIAVFKSI
jgi:hypothetical protein